MNPKIDIIIPVLNEEKILRTHSAYYQWLQSKACIIFPDGGSGDKTQVLAQQFGEVLTSPRGRGCQMNTAAQHAQGEYLLFLHVDTFLTEHSWALMERALEKGVACGGFSLKIDDPGIVFRVFEFFVNMRANIFNVMDGDLGLFIKRDLFESMGGFDEVMQMEDILFSRRIRKFCRCKILRSTIHVSAREWKKGFMRTLLKYSKAYLKMWLGYPQFTSAKTVV